MEGDTDAFFLEREEAVVLFSSVFGCGREDIADNLK